MMHPQFRDTAKELFADIHRFFSGILISEKATIVIPAFNEEKTVAKVVQTALKSRLVDEVIVVDDGSTDGTAGIVKRIPKASLISHEKNMGKGSAIKAGIQNARNEIILFLDADLQNITVEKVERLLLPLLRGEADFVKAGFSLARGRVTEIAVKPMMKIFFPQHEFSQPISGQFGGRKEFLLSLGFDNRWGVDISIFLDALKKNIRVKEIDIGELEHKARTSEEKAEMSKQVMETMLQKSGVFADRFKTIVFSEKALFHKKKPTIEAQRVVKRLQKRKFKVLVLGYSGKESLEEKAISMDLDGYISLGIEDKGMELLGSFKKALKKNGSRMEETALVAKNPRETILLEAAGFGVCFGKSPKLKQKADRTIKTLPEVLLLEEE